MSRSGTRIGFRTLLSAGYALVFALMIAIAMVAGLSLSSLTNTAEWVKHTYEVIGEARLIEKLLVDMETGMRGFLITGTDDFLEPLDAGIESYGSQMRDLKELVSDNPSQVRTLDDIDALVTEWRRTIAAPNIAMRREVNSGEESMANVRARIEDRRGKDIMDSLRASFARFVGVEQDLLVAREPRSEASARRSTLLVILGTAAALLLGIAGMLVTHRIVLRQVGGEPAEIASVAGEIASGNLSVEFRGDTGIGASVSEMLGSLREASHQATLLSRGDFRSEVRPRGEADELGIALQTMVRAMREISRAAEAVASGDLNVKVEPRGDNDLLTDSINRMVATLRAVTEAAKAIAGGDLTVQVESKGEKDVLAESINQMTSSLAESRDRIEGEDWVKTGAAELSELMQGERDQSELGQSIISHLAAYLNAQMASLHLVDEEGTTLTLGGGYALDKYQMSDDGIRIGEGIAGQAALERRIISVTDVPTDFFRINSTLGDCLPAHVLAVPFIFDGKLEGVLEFASVNEFSEIELDLLDRIAEGVAIAFASARSRSQLRHLLENTQRQAEELQAREEELRSANSELESQREELRATNEELEQQSEELRASNEELEEKTEVLEEQKREIEKRRGEVEVAKQGVEEKARELELASRYKSEFLANMSHELRTPLNSLLILTKLLVDNEEGNLTEGQLESAKIIHGGGQELLFLINEILDLSKVEAGMMDVHRDSVEVQTIVRSLQRQFSMGMQGKGLEFTVTVADGTPATVTTDGQRLEQILRNLISNAIKFTEEGMVGVEIGPPPDSVCFSQSHLTSKNTLSFAVRDTGPGIPEEKLSAIFEAFQQADGTTSRRYGGTGLGLSISKALAHLLGGEVQVESEVDTGSVFTFFLPIERRTEKDEASPEESDSLPERPQRRAVRQERQTPGPAKLFLPDDRDSIKEGDRTVLIIEDDAVFAKILMGQARKRGFKCIAAGDGGSGLRMASEFKPSAIILDLGLPDIDGETVLDGLKYDLETRHIPVHVMSARDQTSDVMRKGAVGYLTKPVNADAIDSALRRFEELLGDTVKTVLVIEDDDGSRSAIESLLAAENVEITSASSGGEALELMMAGEFDCVILDVGLPDMTGFELLRSLDEHPGYVQPPTIIYTGRELTSDELRELSRYTANVVVKGADSPERLLDETSLFLHTVESSLGQEQKQMLRMLHDPEKLLRDRVVLLVDDDMRNSFALSKVLKSHGMTVVMAENGQVALKTLDEDSRIELVLMDIMMPVMDGYETMARIREQPHFNELPIIALTAKAMVEDRAKCIEAGANDYLAKPIDLDQLVSLMRVLLSR